MIRRDYILRMIEQLTQVLTSVRRRTQDGEYVEAGTELDQVFRELTGRGADAVAQLSETELLAQLMLDAPTLVVRRKPSSSPPCCRRPATFTPPRAARRKPKPCSRLSISS